MTTASGQAVQLSIGSDGIAEIRFDLVGESINKLNALTVRELTEAVQRIAADRRVKGILLTSAKDCFIVGADITEFLGRFTQTEAEIAEWLLGTSKVLNQLEDMNVPSVAAINGFALGGGCELSLAASFRVMAAEAKIGLPEVKLGIFPGWGGTVRLSRLAGADNAIEWIASGEQYGAEAALKAGVVDAVVPTDKTREAALDLLKRAIAGDLDWESRRAEKKAPLKLNKIEATMVFETAKGFIAGKAGPNYPAPLAAIEAMQKGANKARDEALPLEAAGVAKVAKTQTAHSLVSVFLADQSVKRKSKKLSKTARPVKLASVLGAGIMGGGVAYQSASKKIPILMKDISPKALELGMGEAAKLLEKQVSRGKMTAGQMAETLARIRATLSYGDFGAVDFVVEAVVENEKVKKAVLAELEGSVSPSTIITSNTSTISISRLAERLKRPENFCGMHFFNPVHRMPLVEVIRAAKSGEEAVATTVAYATAMGKTAIVVNDCPGFLVNRVLFPYLAGFMELVREGVDFQRIDKVMEKFGWPMGPAYLLDVVGIDTACHADAVMARGFPDRMGHRGKTAIEALFESQRLGQKNGIGFYRYVPDKKGAPKKEVDPASTELLKSVISGNRNAEVSDQEIIERMMLPMIFECARCLEENIVESPEEVDLSLLYGLGFPPFRGGALRYADSVGLAKLVEAARKYLSIGNLYQPTAGIEQLAREGKGFYGASQGERK